MLVTAVNPNRGPGFPAGRPSLLNRGKFPVLREFQLARRVFAAFCCISEAESRNIKGLALIFSGSVRVRAHARGTGGNRRHATRWRGAPCALCCDPTGLAAGMISAKEREMARSSGTHGADKRPPVAVGHVRRRSIRPQTVIPAQAGIYRSAARASDEWVPAFAGTVVDRRASRAGVLANIVAAPHRVGYRRCRRSPKGAPPPAR